MIIIAGYIYVDEAERDGYLQDCVSIVEQARRAEGCLDFALSGDLLHPGRVNIYERWDSDELLERFRGEGMFPEQASKILHAQVEKYRISAV
jgi:quinol monooxygenase YgiN